MIINSCFYLQIYHLDIRSPPTGRPLGPDWWVTIHRVTKSRTWLKQLSTHTDIRIRISAQSELMLTLCDPMDWGPPGSSVHGILQARVLEWVVMPSSRRSSQPRDRARGLLHYRQILFHLSTWCVFPTTAQQHSPLLSRNGTCSDPPEASETWGQQGKNGICFSTLYLGGGTLRWLHYFPSPPGVLAWCTPHGCDGFYSHNQVLSQGSS